MTEVEGRGLGKLSRALLRADALSWTGPAARVIVEGVDRYRIRQGRLGEACLEGEAHGAGAPPPGDGLAVLYIERGRARWFRLDRKSAVRLAGLS